MNDRTDCGAYCGCGQTGINPNQMMSNFWFTVCEEKEMKKSVNKVRWIQIHISKYFSTQINYFIIFETVLWALVSTLNTSTSSTSDQHMNTLVHSTHTHMHTIARYTNIHWRGLFDLHLRATPLVIERCECMGKKSREGKKTYDIRPRNPSINKSNNVRNNEFDFALARSGSTNSIFANAIK